MYTPSKWLLNTVALLTLCITQPLLSDSLPSDMLKIMNQPRYKYTTWGILVRDTKTGEVIYSQNPDEMFLPSSVTKIFTIGTLLNTFGGDYRIETPVYMQGVLNEQGQLKGNLVLVAKGDLFMGGRIGKDGKISFTYIDHVYANDVPGATLTKEDPLNGLKDLAEQVYKKGIRSIEGDVLIDDRMFTTIQAQNLTISPIIINDNLIDFEVTPSSVGQTAHLMWRPQVPEYTVDNQVKTVGAGESSEVKIEKDASEKRLIITGTIASDKQNLLHTYRIDNPSEFAKWAFIKELEKVGVKVNPNKTEKDALPNSKEYSDMKPVAVLISPPLSDFAKLILKTSHNLGANLCPFLISSAHGQANYDKGMENIGTFLMKTAGLNPDEFTFTDPSGEVDNRITPSAILDFLSYMRSSKDYKVFREALPILGVDGLLAVYEKNSPAKGHFFAKTGTGVVNNKANPARPFFLLDHSLAGYIEASNGHFLEFVVIGHGAYLNNIDDLFNVITDVTETASKIYEQPAEQQK